MIFQLQLLFALLSMPFNIIYILSNGGAVCLDFSHSNTDLKTYNAVRDFMVSFFNKL